MKTSNASADLWARANLKTSARHGITGSDPADALTPPVPIHKLIEKINEPGNLDLLAARSHELSPEQRRKALRTYRPKEVPKARTAAKAAPKAITPGARRIADVPLRGFH